ncbi:MAG: type I-C CRISPR-associated protein Cas8c/Csd1, partial [Salinivirgaceae bacterium]|nr:type I-C CRISPR-associated protein Cas8c/Csd1 [Salinivirgaceae bacterium]
MIKELADFGKSIRKGHDALKGEPIDIDLVIQENGTFVSFSVIERIFRPAEALTSKKGKARLLLDKAEEVLGYVSPRELKIAKNNEEKANNTVSKKHGLFLNKLNDYADIEILKPVFLFYDENKANGIDLALERISVELNEKEIEGNIAFRIGHQRIHEHADVYDAIINRFEIGQNTLLMGERKKCSVCGKTEYPVINDPHGMIKRVPAGQTAGCALVSYNVPAFESYNLRGNDNSSICTNCAKNYVEGLNWLMSNENEIIKETKGKEKTQFIYSNRKNFGTDTAMVFWTKEPDEFTETDWFDKPEPESVANLINSVANAKNTVSGNFKNNQFYSLTLSGAAARIAVRDWIEISLVEYKLNIAKWFEDIRIKHFDFDTKELKTFYPALGQLAWACNRKEAKGDPTISRVAKYLWSCALKNQKPPMWILPVVLKRIAHNETTAEGKSINTFTDTRAALIKFILNRNNYGGQKMKEELDFENNSPAYLCGRLFSLIEGIQRAALGKDLNAGVRERFFSAASTSPSP